MAVHPLYRVSQRAISLEPNLRGQPVFDESGDKIGHVDDVLVEETSIEETGIGESGITPRYLEVGSGHLFHFGERKALVAMADVTVEAHGIRVRTSRFDLFGPEGTIPAQPKQFSEGA